MPHMIACGHKVNARVSKPSHCIHDHKQDANTRRASVDALSEAQLVRSDGRNVPRLCIVDPDVDLFVDPSGLLTFCEREKNASNKGHANSKLLLVRFICVSANDTFVLPANEAQMRRPMATSLAIEGDDTRFPRYRTISSSRGKNPL